MQQFNLGDVVLYGVNGACRIDSVEERADGSYFILVPVHKGRTRLMVPRGNELLVGRMRPLPSRDEMRACAVRAMSADTTWISDSAERKDNAKAVLARGDEYELILLVRSYYEHKQQALASGRRMSSSDNGVLKSAQERVRDEVSLVFDIEPEAVDDFIGSLA